MSVQPYLDLQAVEVWRKSAAVFNAGVLVAALRLMLLS
jgi:hypothetical protein